jgi:hypothetical protein
LHEPYVPLVKENIMLDALLETIGTLAVLASITAKFVNSSAATIVGDDAGRDPRADTASEFPDMVSECPTAELAYERERR